MTPKSAFGLLALATAAQLSLAHPRGLELSPRSLAPPVAPLALNFTDTNGNDVSHLVTLHSHNGTAPLSKRSFSRPIDECPLANGFFVSSSCRRAVSPQAYQVDCTGTAVYASCADTEICIDGVGYRPPGLAQNFPPVLTAFCVSTEQFVDLAIADQGQPETIAQSTTNPPNVVEVVMTGPLETDQITVAGLTIEAQINSGTISNVDLWGSLPGGANSCTQCSSIGLQPVPAGTQRYVASATFNAGFVGARLYWTGLAV